MNELENIQKAKLDQFQEQQQIMQQIAQLETVVRGYLDRQALERYNNLKTAHQELAVQVLVVLSQLVQSRQISGVINDQQLKEVLLRLQPKKEFKITRK